MPGFSLDSLDSDLLDLALGGPQPHRGVSESQSLHTSQSHSQQSIFSQVGLQLPDDSSADLGDAGFMMPGSGSVGPRPSSLLAREDADLLLPDIDIGLDEDGNFIDFGDMDGGMQVGSGALMPSESAAGGRAGEGAQFGSACHNAPSTVSID